ncbi:hypothetical protein PQQ87_16160 [Paraburkholderia nemoris]|uniref:hypothetical protein n=1 Tax=Paraburkholderia nemoris TaxID=2793076 RepID=UPI0038BD26B2
MYTSIRQVHRPNGLDVLGRSRGRLSSNLYLAVDEAGRLQRLIATDGRLPDISCAMELIVNLRENALVEDRGHDANFFVQAIQAIWAKLITPPRSSRETELRYSRALYRTHNLFERFLNLIKYFRRVSTRRSNGDAVGEKRG